MQTHTNGPPHTSNCNNTHKQLQQHTNFNPAHNRYPQTSHEHTRTYTHTHTHTHTQGPPSHTNFQPAHTPALNRYPRTRPESPPKPVPPHASPPSPTLPLSPYRSLYQSERESERERERDPLRRQQLQLFCRSVMGGGIGKTLVKLLKSQLNSYFIQ